MRDSRISLKLPWLAGLLAFLLPGAGHLYQGRLFKATIYFVCILGLFLTGMAMAGWQAVQPPPQGAIRDLKATALLKYGAQAAVGLPAMYGLVQRERYYSRENSKVTEIEGPISAPFSGNVEFRSEQGLQSGPVKGTIFLKPAEQQFGKRAITGHFEGTLNGNPITLKLSRGVVLDKAVDARKLRDVSAAIVDDGIEPVGRLGGTIPRLFRDWFQAPMDEHEEQELHRRLGKYHELAMVFTWIAGLLNVLAIWDAVEGPAYGYGDEVEPDEGSPSGEAGA